MKAYITSLFQKLLHFYVLRKESQHFFSFSQSDILIYLFILRTECYAQLHIFLNDFMKEVYITSLFQKLWSFYALRKTSQHIFLFPVSRKVLIIWLFKGSTLWTTTYFHKWLYEGLYYKPLPEIMKFLRVAQNKPTYFSLSSRSESLSLLSPVWVQWRKHSLLACLRGTQERAKSRHGDNPIKPFLYNSQK